MKQSILKTYSQYADGLKNNSMCSPVMAIKMSRWRLKFIQARRKQQTKEQKNKHINFEYYLKSINVFHT